MVKILLITDSIAKYYSVNINSGELNWSKNNIYPFNSELKKIKIKFLSIDYNNTLRCYYITDGSMNVGICKQKTLLQYLTTKFSLIVINDMVVFSNSIGDITAVDIETGVNNLATTNSK